MSEKTIVSMEIGKIKIGERKRKNFGHVSDLSQSIKKLGQLQPILIDSENNLIAGECRIKAFQLLNRTHIDAIIIPIDQIADREMAELAENNYREGFTISEKVDIAIAIEKKIKESGERRGKKSKDIDNSKDVNMDGGPCLGETTRQYAARVAGFKSERGYRDAREVTEKAICEEVKKEMDLSNISISAALRIARLPEEEQLSALKRELNCADFDTPVPTKSESVQHKKKRKAKRKTVPSPASESYPKFNIIRVSPDWNKESLTDIFKLPVTDHVAPTQCILAIETNDAYLHDAFDCIIKWDFDYAGIFTVLNVEHTDEEPRLLSTGGANFIVLGIRNGEAKTADYAVTINKLAPVLTCGDVQSSLIQVLNILFPNSSDKRIDMTSITKQKGWVAWKLSGGVASESDEDIELENESGDIPVELSNSFDPDSTDIPEADATFEPAGPCKRKLKIFQD